MPLTVTVTKKTMMQWGVLARWAANFLLLTAGLCLGWYLTDYVRARVYASYEEYRLANALNSARRFNPSPPPLTTGDFIGEIDVQRIGLRAIVLEGDDAKTLRLGTGHIPGTALPGGTGNVAIAAHRDRFFRPLRHIRKDDEICVTTMRGTFRYLVDWTRVVDPKDTRVLTSSHHPTLTLVTCYPFYYVGSAPNRFVVRAHQVQ